MTKRRPQILILSSWFPTEKRPFLGNFVQQHASLLSKSMDVTIINTEGSQKLNSIELNDSSEDGVRVIRAHFSNSGNIFKRKKEEKKAFKLALGLTDSVDLIIGHVILRKGWQFILAKQLLKVPLIVVEHASYFRQKQFVQWKFIDRLIFKKTLANTDHLVAVSSFQLEDIKPHIGSIESSVIGNHVDNSFFEIEKTNSEICQFLHVSTLDEATKNPYGIIDACKIVNDSMLDFHLTIVCDEDYSKIESYANNCGVGSKITFVGPLKHKEIPSFLKSTTAFILFSEYESFSIVLAEAIASGTPVISTPVGIAKKLSPDIGILVEQNDTSDLSNAMIGTIKEPKGFNSDTIRNYGLNYSESTILKLWTNLISRYAE